MRAEQARLFEVLGISHLEERLYNVLVDHPSVSADDLAGLAEMMPSQVETLLASLESKGLAVGAAGKEARFRATEPRVAFEALILRQRQRLEESRISLAEIQERYRRSGERATLFDLVEVVRGGVALGECFEQLQLSATSEVLLFVKPPFAVTMENPTEVAMLDREVRYRSIYDHSALTHPGVMESIAHLRGLGEQARVVPEVPLKAAIFDERTALLPLTMDQPGIQDGGLLVHASSLLEALTSLFNTHWERGVGIRTGNDDPVKPIPELPPDCLQVLTLLVSGMQDQAIARLLGVGHSTIDRRVRRVMDALGAKTRTQVGYLAARRGWLGEGSPVAP